MRADDHQQNGDVPQDLFGEPLVTTKYCPACKTRKLLSEFPPRPTRGQRKRVLRRGLCRACRTIQQTTWAKSPRGQRSSKSRRLKKEYGISIEDYDRMLAEQGGGCAICKRTDNTSKLGKPNPFAIDHCHKSKTVVRGLLCHRCNMGLGYFGDDIQLLEAALVYLRKHARTAV